MDRLRSDLHPSGWTRGSSQLQPPQARSLHHSQEAGLEEGAAPSPAGGTGELKDCLVLRSHD